MFSASWYPDGHWTLAGAVPDLTCCAGGGNVFCVVTVAFVIFVTVWFVIGGLITVPFVVFVAVAFADTLVCVESVVPFVIFVAVTFADTVVWDVRVDGPPFDAVAFACAVTVAFAEAPPGL